MRKRIFAIWLSLLCIFLVGCNPVNSQPQQKADLIPMEASWETIPLPMAQTELSAYAVSPADPQTIYACLVSRRITVDLWRTHDAGQQWSQVPLKDTRGDGCSISIAQDQPQRIAVYVTHIRDNQYPRAQDVLYLSTNSGDSWQHLTHSSIAPKQERNGLCTVTATSQHLYLWYSYGGGQNSPQRSLLERSDDAGQTWSRADNTFKAGSLFFQPQIGPDGSLATLVRNNPNSTSALWTSHNDGRSWQSIHSMPQPVGIVLQQSHAGLTSQTPFYALAHEQIPSQLYRIQLFQSTNGQQWSTLPALPIPETNKEHTGILQSLAVTTSGQLLAFGANPTTGMPQQNGTSKPINTFWLWSWNPHTAHWQAFSSSLSHSANEDCGLCWNSQLAESQHNSYLYTYHWGDKDKLFRLRLPTGLS